MWDEDVDVLCYGSGFGALAVAVAAFDAGLDVRIAQPSALGGGSADPAVRSLGAGIDDPDTRAYFDGLSADIDGDDAASADGGAVVVRTVTDWVPVPGRGRIAPFYGARLGEWAHRCLNSPHGVLYTRIRDRGTTSMSTVAGDEIQVKALGLLESDAATGSVSAVGDWLRSQVWDRQIPRWDNSVLRRIVFEDGEVLGAVLGTDEGQLTVRAGHGMAMSTERPGGDGDVGADHLIEPGRPLQVSLVGHHASRFGRVELLHAESGW